MAYRSRSLRRQSSKSKHKFIKTVILAIVVLFVTLNWILPSFITSLGFVTGIFKKSAQTAENVAENPTLAPPVFNVPFEASNTAEINISGYAVADSKVEIYRDDELHVTVDTRSDGSFSGKLTLTLGTNNIYGKTIDEKGQSSLPSKTLKILYDNEKPTLEVSSPSDGQEIKGERKLNVTGKTEVGASVTVNDNQAIVNSDGSFSYTINLNDGDNSIRIKSSDKATNSTEITRTVKFSP